MRGASTPVNILHLLKRIQLDSFSTGSNIASNIIEELVSEGSIRGTLRGGGSSWTPAVYVTSQQQAVKTFYEQNSYIGYAFSKLLIANLFLQQILTAVHVLFLVQLFLILF